LTVRSRAGILVSKPIYDRLAKMSKRKLDGLEYDHHQHLNRFSNAKEGKVNEVQSLDKRLEKLSSKASKELESSIPRALGTAMEMRHVKADLLIAKSVLSVLRSNQFYHRLMVMLIQDVKAGVEYDPSRVDNMASSEFSELVEGSILSTNLDGILGDLRSELDGHLGGGEQ
jgi:hypothetical protein